MGVSLAMPQKSVMDGAVRYLVTNYNPKGNRVGWLMLSSILVEAWDLYSIAFVLVFIKDQYHPDPLLLGLAAAGTQGGALVGSAARRLAVGQDRGDVSCSSPRWCCSSPWHCCRRS